MQATRLCRNCDKPVNWVKVRPVNAKRNVFSCIFCGGATARIKGRRKKDTMPPGLYNYRRMVKIANDLWRHLIYKKAKDNRCPHCGREGIQAMHVFPKKRYPHIRFDLDNGIPGCAGLHRALTNDHEAHRDFCIGYMGQERYEALRLRSLLKTKLDMSAVILFLQAESQKNAAHKDPRDV